MRINADSPLIDPSIIDEAIKIFKSRKKIMILLLMYFQEVIQKANL